jgi:pimeloyl-ACP methyl ester carboxylesterase
MSFTEHHYRSRDGLSLYYRSYGRGSKAVLCLPGLTRNCKDFEDLAEHLAEQWRVISPDLRGRGQSGWDPKPAHYNLGTYVKDVWKLLDELAIERCALIGTSLGGLIAMAMAEQQAQRLPGVVLNDIGPEVPPAAVTRILQYAGRTPPAETLQAAAAQARQAYELAYPDLPVDFWLAYIRLSYRENASGRLEPDMDPAIGEVLRKPPAGLKWLQWLRRHGLMRRLGGISLDPWDSFRALTMPCLLLHGALSDVLTWDIVQRMQAVKPGLEVVTVPDRGHTPLLDEAIALAAIDRFLQRVLS